MTDAAPQNVPGYREVRLSSFLSTILTLHFHIFIRLLTPLIPFFYFAKKSQTRLLRLQEEMDEVRVWFWRFRPEYRAQVEALQPNLDRGESEGGKECGNEYEEEKQENGWI